MYLTVIIVAAVLATSQAGSVSKHSRLLDDFENNIEPKGLSAQSSVNRRFLTITQRPKASYAHKQGETVNLVCDAIGAPAPSVRWFKNDSPVYEYDTGSNELIDTNPSSVARLSSTLLVTKTEGQDVYSCVVTAGAKTFRTTTTVYNIDGSAEPSERVKLYPLVPQILVRYKVYVDTIGTNVVLPCRAKGHPRPHVSWTDNKGNAIKNNPRMKVLRSGELVISPLRWSDMGEFMCRAGNMFGADAAKTFVYPAKAA